MNSSPRLFCRGVPVYTDTRRTTAHRHSECQEDTQTLRHKAGLKVAAAAHYCSMRTASARMHAQHAQPPAKPRGQRSAAASSAIISAQESAANVIKTSRPTYDIRHLSWLPYHLSLLLYQCKQRDACGAHRRGNAAQVDKTGCVPYPNVPYPAW